MIAKQLPCLGDPRHRGLAHVDHCVLDIRVFQSILHKGHIGTRVEQMHCDRMAQRMKAPFRFRNPGPLPSCSSASSEARKPW
jgi:hypothetical protein